MNTIQDIAVIDYGAGNLPNVMRALTHVGARPVATSDPDVVDKAGVVVFPGVGATLDTMESLQRLEMVEAIRESVRSGKPVLGICVGMQVLCDTSEEFEDHACLGIVGGHVRMLPDGQKVPQIGWNQVYYANTVKQHPLFNDIADGSDFYFVHSYYCDVTDAQVIVGTTKYGIPFPSAIMRDNLVAVQFHPEKSGYYGLKLLSNFIAWAS